MGGDDEMVMEGDDWTEANETTVVDGPVLEGDKRIKGLGVRVYLDRMGLHDHALSLNRMGGRGFFFASLGCHLIIPA